MDNTWKAIKQKQQQQQQQQKEQAKIQNTQSKTKPLLRKKYDDNDFFRLWNRTKDKVVKFLMRVNSYILYIVPRYEHYPRL